MRLRDVGGEAAVRALVEAGGQRSADGTPAAPRPRSFKLSLLERCQLLMIGHQRLGPARMIVCLPSFGRRHSYAAGGAGVKVELKDRRSRCKQGRRRWPRLWR